MLRGFFCDDGYRAPRLVVLGIVMAMLAVAGYIFFASRQLAQASGENDNRSAHVRRIDNAIEDAQEAASGRMPTRWRTQ